MKKAVAVGVVCSFALMAAAHRAHAESFFHAEVGIGAAQIKDMGDGTWIQEGAPGNKEQRNVPVLMAGITGKVYQIGRVDFRYHLDYVYMGEFSAQVDAVPDDQYDPVHHKVVNYQGEPYTQFNGHGHVQGIAMLADVGYNYGGWRIGAQAGPWVYWNTWHVTADNPGGYSDLSHHTVPQLGFVVGASIERGPFSVAYRFYQIKQQWNPYPGLATGAQTLMATYRF